MNKIKLKQIEQISADNVVMSEDLVVTKSVGEITVPAGGSVTINHLKNPGTQDERAKTVTELLNDMFSKDENPGIRLPSLESSIIYYGNTNVTNTPKLLEFGTHLTEPIKITANFNAGEYSTHNPSPTGVAINGLCNVSIVMDVIEITGAQEPGVQTNYTFESSAQLTKNVLVAIQCSYTEGLPGKTKKGNPSDPEVKIAAGTANVSKTIIKHYRGYFVGFTTEDKTRITNSAAVRGISQAYQKSQAVKTYSPITDAKCFVVAYPANESVNFKATLPNSTNLDITDLFESRTISVQGYDGAAGINYVVKIYQPDTFYNDTDIKVTL